MKYNEEEVSWQRDLAIAKSFAEDNSISTSCGGSTKKYGTKKNIRERMDGYSEETPEQREANIAKEKEIDDFLSQAGINVENVEVYHSEIDGYLVTISGDWKHDHLRADDLMKKQFGVDCIGTDILDCDGGDWSTKSHQYVNMEKSRAEAMTRMLKISVPESKNSKSKKSMNEAEAYEIDPADKARMDETGDVEACVEEAVDNLQWSDILVEYPIVERIGESYYKFKVYLKFKRGLFEEGYVRELADELNNVFADSEIALQAPSGWKYQSSKLGNEYYAVMYLSEPKTIKLDARDHATLNSAGLYSNPAVLYVSDSDGNTYVFKKGETINSQVRSNGYRQMAGHSSEVVYHGPDGMEGVVKTSCIHPALGDDVDFYITKR